MSLKMTRNFKETCIRTKLISTQFLIHVNITNFKMLFTKKFHTNISLIACKCSRKTRGIGKNLFRLLPFRVLCPVLPKNMNFDGPDS